MIGSLRISLEALRANARTLRALVGAAQSAFVVKGNAYGHGLVETALAIEPLAARLCVFSLAEALELRDGGITAPILVLGPIAPSDLDAALEAEVEVALWDTKSYLRDLAAAARKRHARVRAHVKVNTGLHRLGLEADDLPDAVETYAHLGEIELAGIFSHLAAAEEIDSPYTSFQLERFTKAYAHAEPMLASHGARPLRHIAASAAAMLWPKTRLDMCRFGIALYGLWPSAQTRTALDGDAITLVPALAYESQLVATRAVEAGAAIGYGTSFHAPREMRVGVLPLGYADGVPRAFSNRGAFLVNGARCPIVGRVAMNMCVLDLTNAPSAHSGARVTLIGRDGDAEVSADDWAGWADTINYEIVTRLPSTLRRTFDEG
ncbi:MAG: alanine racemase [bacterium]|nr:alanine racemase [bacterium]